MFIDDLRKIFGKMHAKKNRELTEVQIKIQPRTCMLLQIFYGISRQFNEEGEKNSEEEEEKRLHCKWKVTEI